MTNTIEAQFSSLPSPGDTAKFTYKPSVSGISTQIQVLFQPIGYTPLPGEVVATIPGTLDLNLMAQNYSSALLNGTFSGNLGSTLFSTTPGTAKVTITGNSPASVLGEPVNYSSSFITYYTSVTPQPTGDGLSVAIKVDTLQDAATFLATDFLDLGGKSNITLYRNPKYVNFNTGNPINGNTVLICKDTGEGSGNLLNSYSIGAEGGFTPGNNSVKPGWEWWNRSMLVKDNTAADDTSSLITIDIGQSTNSCLWAPGTKAISDGSALPNTCGLVSQPVLTPIVPGGDAFVTITNATFAGNQFNIEWTATGFSNITSVFVYWNYPLHSTETVLDGYSAPMEVFTDYNTDTTGWAFDFIQLPDASSFPVSIMLQFYDADLQTTVYSNEYQITSAIILPLSWIRFDNLPFFTGNGDLKFYFRPSTSSAPTSSSSFTTLTKTVSLGAYTAGYSTIFIDDLTVGEITRDGWFRVDLEGLFDPPIPNFSNVYKLFADFYNSNILEDQKIFELQLSPVIGSSNIYRGYSSSTGNFPNNVGIKQLTGIHIVFRWVEGVDLIN